MDANYRVQTATGTKRFAKYEDAATYADAHDAQVEIKDATVLGGWRDLASCEINDDENDDE
jgi:hypothetical protein